MSGWLVFIVTGRFIVPDLVMMYCLPDSLFFYGNATMLCAHKQMVTTFFGIDRKQFSASSAFVIIIVANDDIFIPSGLIHDPLLSVIHPNCFRLRYPVVISGSRNRFGIIVSAVARIYSDTVFCTGGCAEDSGRITVLVYRRGGIITGTAGATADICVP